MQRLFLIAALASLSGCATRPQSSAAIPLVEEQPAWRTTLTSQDVALVDSLPRIWSDVLTAMPPRYRKAVASHGDLLTPDAGRDHFTPPPGSYRCRLVKVGPGERKAPPIRAFPDFFCYIRGEKDNELSFAKQTGSELPGGWLHRDGDRRMILAGARQRGPNDTSLAYGADPSRDIVGVLERIGPFRWRLVLPWRNASAGLDIYELTPVPPDQQANEPRVTEVASDKALRTP